MSGFVHPAAFYRGTDEYLARTVPFVLEGLAAGHPVAVAVPTWNLTTLRHAIGTRGDRVHWLDMTEAGRNPGRIIPAVLHAFADRHRDRHVRIIGEPIWPARDETEYPACAQHEALINLAFDGRDATILCPYDAEHLSPTALADAEATHPTLVDGDGERVSDAYDPSMVVRSYNRPLPEPPDAHPLEANEIRLTRKAATELAQAVGLTSQQVDDVALVVTELVTNSIEHGGGTAQVRAWVTPAALVFEIFDTGHFDNPLAGRIPALPTAARGRGLLLVNTLTDLVRLHTSPEGTTIRTYFRRPATP